MDIYETSSMLMNTMSTDLNNALITDPYNYILDNGYGQTSNLFQNDPDKILDFLEGNDYIQGLIDSFASPLREIVSKTEYKVKFDLNYLQKYEDYVNNKLESLDLQEKIQESLNTAIYRGVFFKLLTYNKETNTFYLTDLTKPWKVVLVKRLGKPIGYIRRNSHFIDSLKGVFAAFKLKNRKSVSVSEIKNVSIKNRIIRDLGGNIDEKDQPDILAYTHDVPKGIFHGQAQKLFQIYLNDFILQFLALKDSIRQDIFTVTVNSLTKKTVNTAKVTQAIEEVLNQGSNFLVQQDPQTMLTQVIWAMFNNARVLPCVENYSQITNLDIPNLKEKRAQLQAENEDLKRQVLSNLGIPEELQTGTGNRWEILSRSDKYLTAINLFVSMYEIVIKQLVVSILLQMGRYCTINDVKFSMLNDTPLQSQMARNKTALLTESMRDELVAINEVKMMMGSGYLDTEKVLKEFTAQIQRFNLPFSTCYRDINDILNDMNDPNSIVNQYSDIG